MNNEKNHEQRQKIIKLLRETSFEKQRDSYKIHLLNFIINLNENLSTELFEKS